MEHGVSPSAGAKALARKPFLLTTAATGRNALFNWKQTFEQVALPLAYTSADGKTLLQVNEAFAHLYESSCEALISTPFGHLVTPRSRARAEGHAHKASAADHYAYKTTHLRKNGTQFPARVEITPIRNAAGTVLYQSVYVQDVSVRQHKSSKQRIPLSAPTHGVTSQHPAAAKLDLFTSEQHLRRIAGTSSDVFWIASANHDSIQYLNSAFETVWGRPSDGFDQAQWLNSIVAEDREHASQTFARLGSDDEQVSVTYRIRRPNGIIRHIDDHRITIQDANGHLLSTLGIASDITEHIEAEQSLREAYEFNRQVMADAQEGVIVLDMEGRCVSWNAFMEHLTGDTIADVFGRHVQEVFPALNDIGFETLFRRTLAGNPQVTPDLPYDPLDPVDSSDRATRQWCVLRLAPRRNAQGRITGVIGTVQDITARKQIEAELRASEARYRNLVERASDLIYETDPSGHFTYFNIRAAKRLFGYSEQELPGMSSLDLVHPEFRAAVETIYQQQLEQKIPNVYHEFPVLAKDGKLVWLGQNITLFMEGNRVIRRIAVARDITERKHINERRRQTRVEMEGLQDWSVALQTTIALAHELNQPLNAVCSYNEAALRMLNSGNPYPDKLLHALTASAQQSERAGKVMRDLLAFLGKGHLPATLAPININGVVHQVLADLEVEARANAITLVHHLADNLKPVLSHPLHIEKVLGNLLRNSVEAICGNHNTRGTITVETARQQDCVLVTVRDSGPGFTEAQTEKMLEPFYTSKEKGVGMGLPVSRALIEAHGGKLWAAQGAGATVCFTLPFAS
jgi:PAS domain S-box-containing protein